MFNIGKHSKFMVIWQNFHKEQEKHQQDREHGNSVNQLPYTKSCLIVIPHMTEKQWTMKFFTVLVPYYGNSMEQKLWIYKILIVLESLNAMLNANI